MFIYCAIPIKYPLVHIQGEETATFTNGLGESIDLEITDNQENTIEFLVKILDGNCIVAELLAAEVHRTVICEYGDIDALPDLVRQHICCYVVCFVLFCSVFFYSVFLIPLSC